MRENTSSLADGSLLVLLSCYYSTSLLLALQACEFLDVRKSLTTRHKSYLLWQSPGTVKVHTTNAYRKLSVNNRRAAVTLAKALGLLAAN